jgi:hemoglobin
MTTKTSLYDRLGGADAVRAAVDEFYQRNLATPELAPMFGETSMPALRAHQVRFLTLAFTGTTGDLDVPAYIYDKHKALFLEKGLNAHHFDLVAANLVGTLQHLGVSPALADEAVAMVAPLRSVFETGAERAQQEAAAGNDE